MSKNVANKNRQEETKIVERSLVPTSNEKDYGFKEMMKVLKIDKQYQEDFKQYSESKPDLAEEYFSICMIGVTGQGKSSTCNSVCGLKGKQKYFVESAGVESETSNVQGLVTTWFGEKG